IVSIKNDGHYFCRAGGNRPDGLNEPVTFQHMTIKNERHTRSQIHFLSRLAL
nr:phosphoethanolamine transferase [Escherichia coli]